MKCFRFFEYFEEVDDYLCLREKEARLRQLRDGGRRGFYRRLGALLDSFSCKPPNICGYCRKKECEHRKKDC